MEVIMKELIEYIARSLVDDPMQVQVYEARHGAVAKIRLKVAKEDMGRVIGRNGRVANAMRALLNVAAARQGKQAHLDIEDPR
jgi:predicted RNA-binding protein YlqC (UPF0109 family)